MDDNGEAGTEMIEAFCTKNISWAYENELRFIGSQHGLVSFDEAAIKRVFVAANCPQLKSDVISKLSKKMIKIPLFEVCVREKTYGFGFSIVDY
ncbi:hypothetical protein [Aliiglaciecola lipolytica]|uniref:hypothetical protein n=1 Tax=Aliiglaciecola lipolytica TaxID=477689 RepID=UPI001C09DC44|nr:hypothetical protein [Aliiglaciecola lipolytica]MBU2877602.1 hypothetical protein [Aliiglaciecola lipolytica]